MMDVVIYLDMDGVLSDFSAGAAQLGFKLDESLNKSRHEISVEKRRLKTELYNEITKVDFFKTLPLMPDALELWEFTRNLTSPIILTAAPNFGDDEQHHAFVKAARDKRFWIEKNLGKISDEDFVCTLSHKKQDFINLKPGRYQILIDDRPGNIDRWRAAGGQAILHKNSAHSIAQLKNILKI